MKTEQMKHFCKQHGETFVRNHEIGFISSKKSHVIAGMQMDGKGGVKNIKMRKVGTVTRYNLNKVYPDGDVQIYKTFTNREQIK